MTSRFRDRGGTCGSVIASGNFRGKLSKRWVVAVYRHNSMGDAPQPGNGG